MLDPEPGGHHRRPASPPAPSCEKQQFDSRAAKEVRRGGGSLPPGQRPSAGLQGLHPSWLGPFSPTRPQGPEAGWTVGHMFLDAQRALALGCTARYSWQCFWSRPEGPGRKVLSEEGDPPGDMPTAVGAASRAQDSQPQPLPHPCTDPKGTVASRMVGLLPEALDTQFLSLGRRRNKKLGVCVHACVRVRVGVWACFPSHAHSWVIP